MTGRPFSPVIVAMGVKVAKAAVVKAAHSNRALHVNSARAAARVVHSNRGTHAKIAKDKGAKAAASNHAILAISAIRARRATLNRANLAGTIAGRIHAARTPNPSGTRKLNPRKKRVASSAG